MMVKKRLGMRKSNNGYSISVFVADGETAAALYKGIELFFAKLQQEDSYVKQMTLIHETNSKIEELKHAARIP